MASYTTEFPNPTLIGEYETNITSLVNDDDESRSAKSVEALTIRSWDEV